MIAFLLFFPCLKVTLLEVHVIIIIQAFSLLVDIVTLDLHQHHPTLHED